MTRVLLPTVLRQHADGSGEVEVDGKSVVEALVNLTEQFPALRDHIFDDDGKLRNYVNVFIGDENIRDRDQEQTKVDANDEILIVPALAGG